MTKKPGGKKNISLDCLIKPQSDLVLSSDVFLLKSFFQHGEDYANRLSIVLNLFLPIWRYVT
jgi:hypothetical protein